MIPIIRGRCNRCGFSRNLFLTELGGSEGVACDHADRGCTGTLEVVYRGTKGNLPAEFSRPGCSCADVALELRINSLGGESWTVQADRRWNVREGKAKVEQATGVPQREQRLLSGTACLTDSEKFHVLCDGSTMNLTLVRREREQAEWLERVEAKGALLHEAPEKVCLDKEVVLAAVKQDAAALRSAGMELFRDRDFVFAAVVALGGPDSTSLVRDLEEDPKRHLEWVTTAAAVKVMLHVAGHLDSPELVLALVDSAAARKASEEERVDLVPHLAVASQNLSSESMPSVLKALELLLQGMPRDSLQQTLRWPLYMHLQLGTKLLELAITAPELSTIGAMGRAIERLFQASQATKAGATGALSMQDFAMALLAQHAEQLQVGAERELFMWLLGQLKGAKPPDSTACCKVVRTCLAHGLRDDAVQMFLTGADDSDECVAMLADAAIPLSALRDHAHKAALLQKTLQSWGGPKDVVAAVAQDRARLRLLLRETEGDAAIGRLPELLQALEAAAADSEELPGRALLRAFVTARPQEMPPFRVPLPWVAELRELQGCGGLAVEAVLVALEASPEEDLGGAAPGAWGYCSWQEAAPTQVVRAIEVLKRWGSFERLRAAEAGGREGEALRCQLERELGHAMLALPLRKLTEPRALLAPELPAHGAALLALDHAKAAESSTQELRAQLEIARRETRAATAHAERLESQVESLQRDVRHLRSEVRSQEARGRS